MTSSELVEVLEVGSNDVEPFIDEACGKEMAMTKRNRSDDECDLWPFNSSLGLLGRDRLVCLGTETPNRHVVSLSDANIFLRTTTIVTGFGESQSAMSALKPAIGLLGETGSQVRQAVRTFDPHPFQGMGLVRGVSLEALFPSNRGGLVANQLSSLQAFMHDMGLYEFLLQTLRSSLWAGQGAHVQAFQDQILRHEWAQPFRDSGGNPTPKQRSGGGFPDSQGRPSRGQGGREHSCVDAGDYPFFQRPSGGDEYGFPPGRPLDYEKVGRAFVGFFSALASTNEGSATLFEPIGRLLANATVQTDSLRWVVPSVESPSDFTLYMIPSKHLAYYKGREILRMGKLAYRLLVMLASEAIDGPGWVEHDRIWDMWGDGPEGPTVEKSRIADLVREVKDALDGVRGGKPPPARNLIETKNRVGYRLSLPRSEIRVI